MNKYVFFIVVPNLNYGRFICRTLDSLKSQKSIDVRVAIVDGGSTDCSVELIKPYLLDEGWLFFSEPSLSQSQAIEFGWHQLCQRFRYDPKFVIYGWLNSDDYYLSPSSLHHISNFFDSFCNVDIVSLGGFFVDDHDNILKPVRYDLHPLIFTDVSKRKYSLLQPSTFFKKKVHDAVPFNTNYKYVFDGDFFNRAAHNRFSILCLQQYPVSCYRLHSCNLSLNIPTLRIFELHQLYFSLGSYFSSSYLLVLFFLFTLTDKLLPSKISSLFKKYFRIVNNTISYFSVYLLPSI